MRERPPGSVSWLVSGQATTAPLQPCPVLFDSPPWGLVRFRAFGCQGLLQGAENLRGFAFAEGSRYRLPAAEAPKDALAGLGEAEHPSRPACPPVPSALPQALLPRERMVESRGSADKLMAPIGRHSLTCRSQPDSSTARACSRAGSRGGSCSETQT